jgi:hypothetical protein
MFLPPSPLVPQNTNPQNTKNRVFPLIIFSESNFAGCNLYFFYSIKSMNLENLILKIDWP